MTQEVPAEVNWFTLTRSVRAQPDKVEGTQAVDEVARWLLAGGRSATSPAALLHELSWRLVAAGIPLARTTCHIGTLHPQFLGLFCEWRRRTGETIEAAIAHGILHSDTYLKSPMPRVLAGETVRRRLDGPPEDDDFPILGELRAQGIVEYLATPFAFSDGRIAAATWSTDREGGFSDEDVEQIEALLPTLALLLEVQAMRMISSTLLSVYLGRQTGRRVLAGDVIRGSGVTLRAVLMFADLRDFTALSERLPADAVIGVLNGYFERVVAPIHAKGGEVLKFIGDGLLAIFPIEDAAFAPAAARSALEASLQAFDALASFSKDPACSDAAPVRMAITLHVGDVIYGNIGSEDRLDFTTIGPAVNLVVRLQRVSKLTDRPLLASDEFARICVHPLKSLGSHRIRGVAAPREVFTLPDEDLALVLGS